MVQTVVSRVTEVDTQPSCNNLILAVSSMCDTDICLPLKNNYVRRRVKVCQEVMSIRGASNTTSMVRLKGGKVRLMGDLTAPFSSFTSASPFNSGFHLSLPPCFCSPSLTVLSCKDAHMCPFTHSHGRTLSLCLWQRRHLLPLAVDRVSFWLTSSQHEASLRSPSQAVQIANTKWCDFFPSLLLIWSESFLLPPNVAMS